ncbi:hypothetical protein ACFQY0_09895 [Haloferula chungangensis]|uniref:Uncharacterized protein n=1 Tax=Haloferula chungangensis TaxID=1048331 RepID=A0ABW2L7N5_9BACT
MDPNPTRIPELEARISELRASLDTLETRLEQVREEEQHAAIDHLESYINAVDTRFTSFSTFWKAMLEDFRKIK